MITDLTGMAIANASMLDEGTAAAEAMTLMQRVGKPKSNVFFVADDVLPQTHRSGADARQAARHRSRTVAAAERRSLRRHLLRRAAAIPGRERRRARLPRAVETRARRAAAMVVVAADLLALTLLTPPGEWGADVVVGNTQRFGVPLGFGGPHAAYLATRDEFKRSMPGRLVGVTVDAQGNPAYRLALQTREQHIRREKATSNICTAQVLLAVMRQHVRGLPRPAGLKRDRAPRAPLHRAAGARARSSSATRSPTPRSSTR